MCIINHFWGVNREMEFEMKEREKGKRKGNVEVFVEKENSLQPLLSFS